MHGFASRIGPLEVLITTKKLCLALYGDIDDGKRTIKVRIEKAKASFTRPNIIRISADRDLSFQH